MKMSSPPAQKEAESKNHKSTPPLVSLISGGVAGGVEGFLTYPFEFAKTRVQLGRLPGSLQNTQVPKNPFLIVSHIYKSEGLRALYKGCSALVIGSVGKDAVRFLSFDTVKNAFQGPGNRCVDAGEEHACRYDSRRCCLHLRRPPN
jgi:solute carrier family 25 citrate transporter 1